MPELNSDQVYLIKCMKRQASEHIDAYYPDYKQRNAALGIYGEEEKLVIVNFIQAVIAQVDVYEAEISEGQTPEINFGSIVP